MTLPYLLFLALPLLLIAAALTDLTQFRIPNLISGALAVLFVPFALSLGMGWEQIAYHFALGFFVLFATYLCFLAGWMGGGDAKLLAVCALWIGPGDVMLFLVAVTIAGGILCLALVLFRRLPLTPFVLRVSWIEQLYMPDNAKRSVPYAVAIAGGMIWALPQLDIFKAIA